MAAQNTLERQEFLARADAVTLSGTATDDEITANLVWHWSGSHPTCQRAHEIGHRQPLQPQLITQSTQGGVPIWVAGS